MSDLLRLKKCFYCDYDLRGSHAAGRCPECGNEYTAEMFDVELLAHRSRRDKIVSALWMVWLPIFGSVMLVVGLRQSGPLLIALGFLALLLSAAIVWSAILTRHAGGHRTTVVFLNDGLLSEDLDMDDSGETGIWHWNNRARATIERTDRADCWRLQISSPDFGVSNTGKEVVVVSGLLAASEAEAQTIAADLQRRFALVAPGESPTAV